jgi:hypothetical protein
MDYPFQDVLDRLMAVPQWPEIFGVPCGYRNDG